MVVIDELGPGEVLGWAAVMEPHVYTASAWTTEPSELIVVKAIVSASSANRTSTWATRWAGASAR